MNLLKLETADENYGVLKVKCAKDEYSVMMDYEDYIKLKNKDFTVVKQHGYATINVYTNKVNKQRKSLGKILLNTDKNVYLKDRYFNKQKYLLDYRKSNLTTSIKEMEGYSQIARNNYYKSLGAGLLKHGVRNYNMKVAQNFMNRKNGEDNKKSKLTLDMVREIRQKYSTGAFTQEKLAKSYNVSKSTISSIVTYKRWKDIDFKSKRIYDSKNVSIIREKLYFNRDRIQDGTYYIVKEQKYIYIEKLNEDGLYYIEIRDNKNNVLARADIFFLNDFNNQTKRDYSIASTYPAKTPKSKIFNYFDSIRACM